MFSFTILTGDSIAECFGQEGHYNGRTNQLVMLQDLYLNGCNDKTTLYVHA